MTEIKDAKITPFDYFDVEELDKSFMAIVPKRIRAVRPYPGLTAHQADYVFSRLLTRFDFAQFKPCWSYEMRKRSIPYVTTDPRPERVLAQFQRFIGPLLDLILPGLTLYDQTYNKTSTLGYPIHANPNYVQAAYDKRLKLQALTTEGDYPDELSDAQRVELLLAARRSDMKRKVLFELFEQFEHGDFSSMDEHMVTTLGRRDQHEDPSKLRAMPFINNEGVCYEEEVNRQRYAEPVRALSDEVRVPMRTRIVNGPAVSNLYLQVVDTQIHSYISSTPLCDSNVFAPLPHLDHVRSFDCKNYERDIGLLVDAWGATVGGIYERELYKLAHAPFVVPSDTWKKCFLIKPKLKSGQYLQLGSGLCVVSTLGKLANICVQIAYFVDVKKLAINDAIDATLRGHYDGLRRWAFGDDNRLAGNASEAQQFIDWMANHFNVVEDEQPQYLGARWSQTDQRSYLSMESYIVKYGLRERDYSTYPFPYLGQVQRREKYKADGDRLIATEVIPYEEQLYSEIGVPWYNIVKNASRESQLAHKLGLKLTEHMVLEKEYLANPRELLQNGFNFNLGMVRTEAIFRQLVGQQMNKQSRFTRANI